MSSAIIADAELARPKRPIRGTALLRASGAPGVAIVALILIAVVGPWVAPYDPNALDPTAIDKPPLTPHHFLGTDSLGRDLLSRVLAGAHLSLITAFLPIAIAGIIGLTLGAFAAFAPRAYDFTIMRITDVALAFPAIMLAIAISAMLGPSFRNALLAMTVVLVPPYTRVARATALEVRGRPYMAAARLSGASRFRAARDFALPNIVPPVLVMAATQCGVLIIFAAGLSFLGLGVQPPTAEWGRMVADGRTSLLFNPWSSIIPGVCIFLASVAFNFLGDRWRDYLDPRSRD